MRINHKNLEYAMAEKKWRFKDLAAAMGIHISTLRQQMGSRKKPRDVQAATIGRMAEALGVSVRDIGI
jgi:DNA-binding Xre family transcriptional regulator